MVMEQAGALRLKEKQQDVKKIERVLQATKTER